MSRHPAFDQGYRNWYNGIVENPFARIFRGRYVTDSIASKEYEAGQNKAYTDNLEPKRESTSGSSGS